jgi:hypothetical protein
MTRNQSMQGTLSAARSQTGRPAVAAPAESTNRPTSRVLLRLPDLREPPKRAIWLKALGVVLALLGGSGLGVARRSSSRSADRHKLTDDGEFGDTVQVFRLWKIYKQFRPLVHYVVSHPKTIVSGALAAAAQFAALVAWHESNRTPAAPVGPIALPYQSAPDLHHHCPSGHRPSYYHAGHHAHSMAPPNSDCDACQGPCIVDPRPDGSMGRATPWNNAQAHPTESLGSPGAALNRATRLSPQGGWPGAAIEQQAAPTEVPRMAARYDSSQALSPSQRQSGVAYLEGGIIPPPPRETRNEPAQSSIH